MTIEKLPSGSYRIRQQYKGKRYTITLPYKPTLREADELIHAQFKNVPQNGRMSFYQACLEYTESKRNVLSPRTVREYILSAERYPLWFQETLIDNIDNKIVQRVVNELALTLKPKSVRTRYGLISAVLKVFRSDLILNITLPQKVEKEVYIPTEEEVKTILEYTDKYYPHFYIPLALASSCGLRREEIIALKPSDIKDGMISVSIAMVQDESGQWVKKTTKTVGSTRKVPINPALEERILTQGYVYNGGPQSISNYLVRIEQKLGMEQFSLHKLRHFYASVLLSHGVSLKDVQNLGGWSNMETLSKIYAHAMRTRTDEQKKEISSRLWESIF